MLISLRDHVQSDLLYLLKTPAAPFLLHTAPLPCSGEEGGSGGAAWGWGLRVINPACGRGIP